MSDARIDVQVMPIEPEYCRWCELYDDAEVPVTHTITVTPWFGPWGANATWTACLKHARAIEKAIRQQIAPYRSVAQP